MQVKKDIRATGQTVPAWRTVGPAAAVTALAAVIFLAVWSPTSAKVTQSESNSPAIELVGASLLVGSEQDERAKQADRLAVDYRDWLQAAHRSAGVNAESQPLPAQF